VSWRLARFGHRIAEIGSEALNAVIESAVVDLSIVGD
jgi:hypothetical protein